jgi:MOSC domain-containing protein YiiM
MPAHVRSVNTGRRRPLEGVRRTTAIAKSPVERIGVRDPGPKQGGLGSGVVGDEIGSTRHHGGSLQAVYAVAREELDWWARHLGRDLPDGMFGENLTTEGLDVDGALLGETWRVGTALLEVTAPRIPCATFAARMREPHWVSRFAERGRTGAYLAVVEAGVVERGDPVVVEHRPAHDVTVPDHFRACLGDRAQAERILALGVLRPEEHAWLAARVPALR